METKEYCEKQYCDKCLKQIEYLYQSAPWIHCSCCNENICNYKCCIMCALDEHSINWDTKTVIFCEVCKMTCLGTLIRPTFKPWKTIACRKILKIADSHKINKALRWWKLWVDARTFAPGGREYNLIKKRAKLYMKE